MSETMAFWEEKSLSEMTREEWESLCDHCGKCCLIKLEDENGENEVEQADSPVEEDTQQVYYTNIICNLFNTTNGHCSDYRHRETRVPECLRLTPENLEQIEWLPPSCSYRRLMEGRGLPDWHHLISGDKNTIHATGHSALGKIVLEKECFIKGEDDYPYENHIVDWPLDDG